MPQKAAIGSAAWASTTTANARSNASPSTCERAMRINSQNPCVARTRGTLNRCRLRRGWTDVPASGYDRTSGSTTSSTPSIVVA